MRTFRASTEERYVWECPYCGNLCEDDLDDPSYKDTVTCEHCGQEAECEGTDR
jgi:transcription elongation factor Elf1